MSRTVRVRRSSRARSHRRHLYRTREDRRAAEADFERRYGKRRGRYIYGATVGKVHREQQAKRRRR